ncbi:MAG: glycosyltransferase family 4 protein [Anaerolineae bacterium]
MVAPTSFFADYGCHVRILEEARVLTRKGQDVSIVTYYSGGDVDELDIMRTAPIPWRRDYEVGSSRHKIGFDMLLGARTAAAVLRLRPDVVHGHLHEGALIGGAIARMIRRPLVFDFQGSLSGEMIDHGFLNPEGRLVGPVRRMERLINDLPDAILTSSRNAAAHLVDRWGVKPARLHALPDCVNTSVFHPELLDEAERSRDREALGIPRSARVVVYLGLLARHQGTDLLLQAARRVVDARTDTYFLVMGFPGPDVYAAQAQDLGLTGNVVFTGRVPYADAPRRLALGDVAVAPKLSATEGSGKLLNYMSMGLPTVTFDTPVSREYLGDDGVYAVTGDATSLADRLLQLLDDLPAAATAGARLRERAVAEFDWDRAGDVLIDVYDLVARRRAGDRATSTVEQQPRPAPDGRSSRAEREGSWR